MALRTRKPHEKPWLKNKEYGCVLVNCAYGYHNDNKPCDCKKCHGLGHGTRNVITERELRKQNEKFFSNNRIDTSHMKAWDITKILGDPDENCNYKYSCTRDRCVHFKVIEMTKKYY